MKNILARQLCRMLMICVATFPLGAHARMVGTDQVIAAAQAQGARGALHELIRRSDVSAQLQSFGVGAEAALARVNALTDTELANITGHIDRLPAGGGSMWAIIVALLILELIIYFWVD